MNLLSMKDVSKAFTDKVLLDGASFGIDEGDRIGIIGINGTGKSTLLRLIAGQVEEDSGDIVKGNNVVISYLPQNPEFDMDYTLYEYVVSQNVARRHPQDPFEAKEFEAQIEGEAKKILNILGFNDIGQKVSKLSGGQRKKAALCARLLENSDILLLDEPTNHLDNAMNEWLQTYLENYRGALVMVTHDRYFLDLVCNKIVEVDQGRLYTYDTNYEGYLELRAQRIESALSTQDKHANILRKEIAWMRRGARARSTKQKAHIKRYEALRDEEKLKFDGDVEISAISSRLGKKTIELYNIGKSYGDRTLIKDFTFTFTRDDRIGILGPNGCGKTTLMKMIVGSIPPDSGHIEIGETVKIGYYAQEADTMDDNQRVIDYVKDTAEYIKTDDGYISASQMCEKFLFEGSLQYQPIGKLSGGEKRRLYLCKVLMEAPNVLILDEPTNDLDIKTLQILEDYLDSFPGIVIAVSHDRYFLDRVGRRMLTFDSYGGIHLYNGSYTEFFETHKEGVDGSLSWDFADDTTGASGKNKSASGSNSTAASGASLNDGQDIPCGGSQPSSNDGRGSHKLKFSYKEQKEYETIEDDIAKSEEKIAGFEEDILANATDFGKLRELGEKKEAEEKRLEELMERYVYLEEKAEEIAKQNKE
ncbi:ABC-F family ATP-binding cassette domain-containing protein [Butyrivibrio fibrisolvens]|uniref:ABC-F family ATP-binding cassette domain-containing protein n=1 Tax=Butyrivibrio fibrisolvens TaxID=831 RepID=UPI00040F9489|nr:ABC-F family ATP-binding cassette domain-containing protein [Butyrivibrio fibrisolvens]